MKNQKQIQETTTTLAVPSSQVAQDLKHSVLIVSLVLNLVIFTAWVALQITTRYDESVAQIIFR